MFNYNSATNVALSSNERLLLTGSSVLKKSRESAALNGFDTLTGEKVCEERPLAAGVSIPQVNWDTVTN